jgi:hypothetical protein
MSEFQPKPGDVVAVKMKWDEPWDDPGDVAPWVPAERIAALEALEEAWSTVPEMTWRFLLELIEKIATDRYDPYPMTMAEASSGVLRLRLALAASLATREAIRLRDFDALEAVYRRERRDADALIASLQAKAEAARRLREAIVEELSTGEWLKSRETYRARNRLNAILNADRAALEAPVGADSRDPQTHAG